MPRRAKVVSGGRMEDAELNGFLSNINDKVLLPNTEKKMITKYLLR